MSPFIEWFQLKQLQRTGWVRKGVENAESVAAHSWGMAVLALELAPDELDLRRVLSLCLLHDLAEVRVGDLTPYDDTTTKEHDERIAMQSLAPQWLELFEDYQSQSSEEAKFVKQLDKLDMAIQSLVYEDKQGMNLQEFRDHAKQFISNSRLQAILEPSTS